MTGRLLLFLTAGLISLPAGAETPPLLASAIGTWASGKEDWAFTLRTRMLDAHGEIKEEKIEHYDPALPDERRWQLVEFNGNPPSESKLMSERRKNRRPRKYGTESPDKLLDLQHATIRDQTPATVTFEVPIRPIAVGLAQTDKLVVLITVDRKTEAVERLTTQLLGPMRIALGLARITDVDLDLSIDPAEEKAKTEGSAANGTAHVTLTALGGRMDYAWTDFKRVQGWTALSPTR
jgi:hypothetical protein